MRKEFKGKNMEINCFPYLCIPKIKIWGRRT